MVKEIFKTPPSSERTNLEKSDRMAVCRRQNYEVLAGDEAFLSANSSRNCLRLSLRVCIYIHTSLKLSRIISFRISIQLFSQHLDTANHFARPRVHSALPFPGILLRSSIHHCPIVMIRRCFLDRRRPGPLETVLLNRGLSRDSSFFKGGIGWQFLLECRAPKQEFGLNATDYLLMMKEFKSQHGREKASQI
jgi:hypothetical protein